MTIRSHPANKNWRDNYDAVFGKKRKKALKELTELTEEFIPGAYTDYVVDILNAEAAKESEEEE